MFARRNRIQLVAFVLIATTSVVYAGARYAGLGSLFGPTGYTVTVALQESGGLYAGSEVSYRGVAVGKVEGLRLTDSGIDAMLDMNDGGAPIPADTSAKVADRSAVGEQYLDLQPANDKGPYLHDGSVIQEQKTSLPLSPDTVLSNVDKLVSSINPESLRTVVDETYDAFHGTGPDLQKLLNNVSSLTTTAQQNLPQTQQLLSTARTVLNTQQRQTGNLYTFSDGLSKIATQFKKSDPDLRKILDSAPGLTDQVRDFLATSGNGLGTIFANLLTTTRVTATRNDALQQLLVTFPVITAFTPSTSPDGTGHLGIVLDFFNPPSCTRGYESTRERGADDLTDKPVNTKAYCAEPKGSPIDVRGAQNTPFGGIPQGTSATPQPVRQQLPGLLSNNDGKAENKGIGSLLGTP